ncbi:hypothetical protein ACQY0O_007334 [Thecaphora frezii]
MPTIQAVKQSETAVATHPQGSAAPKHPPYLVMIQRCIADEGDSSGVSRQTIKKFLALRYGLDPEQNSTKHAITKAIQMGVAQKKLVLPKGISGKIKQASLLSKKRAKGTEAKPAKLRKPKKPEKQQAKAAAARKPTSAKATKSVVYIPSDTSGNDDDDNSECHGSSSEEIEETDTDEETKKPLVPRKNKPAKGKASSTKPSSSSPASSKKVLQKKAKAAGSSSASASTAHPRKKV